MRPLTLLKSARVFEVSHCNTRPGHFELRDKKTDVYKEIVSEIRGKEFSCNRACSVLQMCATCRQQGEQTQCIVCFPVVY
mmetsp:Transcript_16441/g.26741  ORF Transcript_16441/g.26741 Transcript_16441/m.26741 type:complete len:80 (-) Transcript_16441:394-633(-)